jgi:hypothetical protein
LSESITSVLTKHRDASLSLSLISKSVSSRPKNTTPIYADRKQKQKSKSKSSTSAQPAESKIKVDVSKPAQSGQEKKVIVRSTPEKTSHSEKRPPKTSSADQKQKQEQDFKSSTSVQSAQTKPLKVYYRRDVPEIQEPQEVKSKRPQASMKTSSSLSQVSRRGGAGSHSTKRITAIGTRTSHSAGRELVGGIEACTDESTKRDTGDKHVRQKEKKDSADSLRQPGPSSPSNSKPAPSAHTQRAADPIDRKPALAPSRHRSFPRPPSSKISRSSLFFNAPALLSMESMDESVDEVFVPTDNPRPHPTLLTQALVKRKPILAPSTRPKPVNEKPPEHSVLSKNAPMPTGIKASHQSKLLQGPAQGKGEMKSAPIASMQPQQDYQASDKASATNAQGPSSFKDDRLATGVEARLATGVEASHQTKEAAAQEENYQSLTQPESGPQDGNGAVCHVRVTLGNLSGAFTSRDPSTSKSSPKDRDNSLVVGYAEIVTVASQAESSMMSADSIPITPQMGDVGKSPFHIVWSRGKKVIL